MLEELKIQTLTAIRKLETSGLDSFGFGNISAIDRESGLVVARPSKTPCKHLTYDDMLVVDLMGECVEGDGAPTEDLYAHLELYKNYADLDVIVLTRSTYATAFAQAGRDIPFYGALHADFFSGDIPCVRSLSDDDIEIDYERNIGKAIIEEMSTLTPDLMPAVLVRSHGAFVFGHDTDEALTNAAVLEEVAKLAFLTETLQPDVTQPSFAMLEKRFCRRHRLQNIIK